MERSEGGIFIPSSSIFGERRDGEEGKGFLGGEREFPPKKLEGIQAWPLVRNLHNIRIEASTETIVKCLCLFVFPRLQSPESRAPRTLVHLSGGGVVLSRSVKSKTLVGPLFPWPLSSV